MLQSKFRTLFALCLSPVFVNAAQRVDGAVLDSLTGTGIPRATVTFYRGSDKSYDTVCDARGAFHLDDVAEGEYRVDFSASGYGDGFTVAAPPRIIRVNGIGEPLEFRLVPFAHLSGRVVDPDGNPFAGIAVVLELADGFHEWMAISNAGGVFSFDAVSPHVYRLSAVPPAKYARSDIMETFYPNLLRKSESPILNVRAGESRPDLDIHLRTAPLHHISGSVRAGSTPASGAQLTLYNQLTNTAVEFVSAENGSYVSPAVRDGKWVLSAELSQNGRPWRDGTSVDLAGRDVEDRNLHLSGGFQARVSIEIDGKPSAGCLEFLPEEGPRGGTHVCGPAREFEVGVYPRVYRIMPVGLMPSRYLSAIEMGDRDITGQPTEMSPGSLPIRIMFESGGGALRGAVENCEGAAIVAVPQDPTLRSSNGFGLIRTAACGEGGVFQIQNMRPGSYYVFAFDHIHPSPNGFPELSQSLLNSAVRVRIAEGETEYVSLRVQPLVP